jgi:CAAX prenyl protease-like protein
VRLLEKKITQTPALIRVAPFLIFLALTFCQGKFGAASAYWFYFGKTFVGAWLLWEMRPFVSEMRWAFSWEAVVVGFGVFVIWIGLDPFYPHLIKNGDAWNPPAQFGENSVLAWLMIVARILGSTFVVPLLEEVFYRSFVYRYIANQNFLSVPLNKFLPLPFFATAIVFGFSHNEWLAGILCGAAYQWLVLRKNRLGDAMTAHAITNFLLGLWVVWRGAWHFW